MLNTQVITMYRVKMNLNFQLDKIPNSSILSKNSNRIKIRCIIIMAIVFFETLSRNFDLILISPFLVSFCINIMSITGKCDCQITNFDGSFFTYFILLVIGKTIFLPHQCDVTLHPTYSRTSICACRAASYTFSDSKYYNLFL